MSGTNPKIRFISKEHEQFYKEMIKKSGVDDSYHRSFFIVWEFPKSPG